MCVQPDEPTNRSAAGYKHVRVFKRRLRFVNDTAVETPAARAARAQSAEQAAAARAIEEDPLVQSLQREMGARVIPESVRPAGQLARDRS